MTTREFVTSPPLMSVLMYEIYVRGMLQKCEIDASQAQILISKATMEVSQREVTKHGAAINGTTDDVKTTDDVVKTTVKTTDDVVKTTVKTTDDVVKTTELPIARYQLLVAKC